MKNDGITGGFGRAAGRVAIAIAIAVRMFAQSPPLEGATRIAVAPSAAAAARVSGVGVGKVPLAQEGKPVVGTMSERLAESEWIRGYREGYELGLWTGVHDARALLGANMKVPGQSGSTRLTPYRHGYASGYTDGYRKGYSLWPGGIW